MEYQKIANLLDNASNQPSKFRTKNWVEINDESRGTYSVNRQINFKTLMLRSSLCDYSDTYKLLKEIYQLIILQLIILLAADNTNKKVIFKNCAPSTYCISKNNTQVDNAKDIDLVMPIIIQKHLEAYGNIVKIYQLNK